VKPEAFEGIPDHVAAWPSSVRHTFRAALYRYRPDLADAVTTDYKVKRFPDLPSDEEIARYEEVANQLTRGPRALALLPLRLGFRVREIMGLTRDEVQRAVKTNRIKFVRKGGFEGVLPTGHTKNLLEDLLAAKGKTAPWRAKGPKVKPGGKWLVAGEIVSRGNIDSQCSAFYRLITSTGKKAGIKIHPHTLRHIFATRMNSKGASLPIIGKALGHRNLVTTARYVHPDLHDIEAVMRADLSDDAAKHL
jgi:integrase